MVRGELGPVRRRGGFTLIELLVVIFIVLIVSAVALPTVYTAMNGRQVDAAARILQGTLTGARDQAIHDNRPSGIRLLPDPAFNGINPATGLFDPAMPLAYNRIVPIGPAPDYSEGRCIPWTAGNVNALAAAGISVTVNQSSGTTPPWLVLIASPIDPATGAPVPPANWYWNVRVGDKVQINDSGPWYTVVGPASATPGSPIANPEWFANEGAPGSPLANAVQMTYLDPISGQQVTANVEWLALTNGADDDGNGWTDEGRDGIDNNGDGNVDEYLPGQTTTVTWTDPTSGSQKQVTVQRNEWEPENWHGSLLTANTVNVPYTIRRRPAPSSGAREVALPTGVVIDATTWNGTLERSRLPIHGYNNGLVDIMVNPDGTAYSVLLYGTQASMPLGGSFFHFFLSDRQDVMAPSGTAAPTLAIPMPGGADANAYQGPTFKGDWGVVTLNSRTGQIVTNMLPRFDDPLTPANGTAYNQAIPFIPAEQGAVMP
jgi:prepilin-type N-terminal cleavage/methylation domain-containing protein